MEKDSEKEALLVKCGWMPTHSAEKNRTQATDSASRFRAERDTLSSDFEEDLYVQLEKQKHLLGHCFFPLSLSLSFQQYCMTQRFLRSIL